MQTSAPAVRILVADDHTIFRDGLRRLLEAEPGFSVVAEASDGAEAVEMVRTSTPDLLLLDLAMPRVPGLEALRELTQRKLPLRIILLTAAIEPRQVVEALQLGASGVVMKDAATQMLIRAIDTVLRGGCWVGREEIHDLPSYLKRQMATHPVSKAKSYGLTRREIEILGAISDGLTNREIAVKFALSEDTVKHHLTSIFDKLGVVNRLELALFAINNHLVD
jgi:DNA-binding NarL/FixJ family response regulator